MKYSNFSIEEKAQEACEEVYEKQGADAYNKCYADKLKIAKNAVDSVLSQRGSQDTKTTTEDEKKFPTWAKVAVIVGGLAVVGTLIYFAVSKK